MKDYIDKLKEIETLVELSIGTTMTEQKATDIYSITNDLMCKVKKLHISGVIDSELFKLSFENYIGVASLVEDDIISDYEQFVEKCINDVDFKTKWYGITIK